MRATQLSSGRGSLAARRVRQTLTSFSNGPVVLGRIAGRRWRRTPDDLLFRLRDGRQITCPNVPGARVPVFEVFSEGAYRLPWFTADLPQGVVAADIGGHIGCFSVALATERPDATIRTFEASPSTARYTRRNVEDNGLGDRITVDNTAVSSYSGTLSFADNAGGSGLNGLTAPEGTTAIDVPCVTFAEVVARAGGKVDLVKIDTEGAEYDIILGSEPADWAGVQRLVMEYHPVDGHSWAELRDFLASAGLEVVHQEPVTERLGTAWLSRTPLAPPA